MSVQNMLSVLLIVSVLFTSLSGVHGQSSCNCVDVVKCSSALSSVLMSGSHSLDRCGWNGFMERVCCLDTGIIGEQTTTSDESNVWGSGENTQMSSSKFPGTTTKPGGITDGLSDRITDSRKSDRACAQYSAAIDFAVNWYIIGGDDAEEGEFPHMAALGFRDADNPNIIVYICAGSLISERYVLTAAHCAARTRPIKVLLGVLTLTRRQDDGIDIESITLHPDYLRAQGRNDIALVRMAKAAVFGPNIYPACLYNKGDDPLGLMITGWGKVQIGRDNRSDVLQKARVVPVSLSSCNITYVSRLNRALTAGQLCAGPAPGAPPTDSCPGDSGGPLQVYLQNMYAVVGVISFGITDCGGDSPSVYSRVHHYLDWIEGIVWP